MNGGGFLSEKELIKSLRRGDLSALEDLIDRYTPYISSIISRILRGCQADVEELTADVFLAAWDNRDKLRSGQVKGYLGAIARNRAFNLLRSHCESLPLEDDVLILETDGPDKELDRKETARVVNKALSQLDRPGRLSEANRRRLAACGARVEDRRELDSVMEKDVVTNFHVSQILTLRQELLETLSGH